MACGISANLEAIWLPQLKSYHLNMFAQIVQPISWVSQFDPPRAANEGSDYFIFDLRPVYPSPTSATFYAEVTGLDSIELSNNMHTVLNSVVCVRRQRALIREYDNMSTAIILIFLLFCFDKVPFTMTSFSMFESVDV